MPGRLTRSLAVMKRESRALAAMLALTTLNAVGADEPQLRFEVWIPGALAEQIEAEFLYPVQAQLKIRPGVTEIRSTASQHQATVRVAFESMPRCTEIDELTAIVARVAPKGSTQPQRFFDNLTCKQ